MKGRSRALPQGKQPAGCLIEAQPGQAYGGIDQDDQVRLAGQAGSRGLLLWLVFEPYEREPSRPGRESFRFGEDQRAVRPVQARNSWIVRSMAWTCTSPTWMRSTAAPSTILPRTSRKWDRAAKSAS